MRESRPSRPVLGAACMVAAALAAGLSTSATAAHSDGRDSRGPLDVRKASIGQDRQTLGLHLRTAGAWNARELVAKPAIKRSRPESYLCFELRQDGKDWRYCAAKEGNQETRMVGGRLNRRGGLRHGGHLQGARITRKGSHALGVRFAFRKAGLGRGHFGWRVLSGWGDESCYPDPPPPRARKRAHVEPPKLSECMDKAPDRGVWGARVIRPHIVGCTRDEHRVAFNGPRSSKRIALTFDDGPSVYTSRVIDILNHNHVHGTFFVVGDNIPGHSSLLQRMVRGRHEIGNHSLRHKSVPTSEGIRETSARVRSATGFQPCIYRPPGGSRTEGPISAAWNQGMSSVLWDVDTNDWQGPSAATIYSRVVDDARNGSIVLMHDGGGNRSQTVAALDRIIHTLKGRGYRLVTVTSLLHERYRWAP